ncbi:Hpt domain-containing protein, partial [Cellulosimicrobium funkei]|uniref:Hpt domain-containing protein n=1 Tax=Cellulosimicrobium funkei TaxID=264251 RepID=UPI0037570707
MDEIVHEFLVESYENLDQLDQDLVALESDPSSRALLSSIFRTVHTIKGTSGFLGFGNLERVSHVGESLLSELRDGERAMDQPTADVLLALVDTLRAILAKVESGAGDDLDVDPMVARIVAVQDGTAAPEPDVAPAVAAGTSPDAAAGTAPETDPETAPEPEPEPTPAAGPAP